MMSDKLEIEREIREAFNTCFRFESQKKVCNLGESKHEFDVYEEEKLIGGINTSPWRNKSGTNNTGGQDRVCTELLWLTLWNGKEKRVLILTDCEMFEKILKRFKGINFSKPIEVYLYSIEKKSIVNSQTL